MPAHARRAPPGVLTRRGMRLPPPRRRRNCAQSCGLCTAVCMDHEPDCSQWAQLSEGRECDHNKAFMQTTCPASCGVCSELQAHLAGIRSKDEL